MERIANRLERLEARTPPPAPVRPGRVSLADLRRLEEHVKRLEAGVGPTSSAPACGFAVAESVAPDGRVAAVVRELERLELLDHAREG
jgi:hypothetical protein